jgi:hypothetical protein
MSAFTPNYNLKKPLDTENYDVADQNGNMDLIDTALTPTADPAQVPTGLSGKLSQWVSWFTNRIKAILGTSNWYDAPPTTLTAANSHMTNTNNPHSTTAAQVGAVNKNGDTMTGPLILNADPVQALGAATRQYVDAIAQGLSVKQSVRAATTGSNITLSGAQTIDGIALNAGDRVLVKDQTSQTTNGIYVVAAGAWSRASDADLAAELIGMFTFVEQGTVNAASGWVLPLNTITLGTTNLVYTQFSGAGEITAGTGLQKSGNTLSLAVGAALANLGFTPVNKAGDSMSNALTMNMPSAAPPFVLNANAQGQKVIGLNAEQVDGYDANNLPYQSNSKVYGNVTYTDSIPANSTLTKTIALGSNKSFGTLNMQAQGGNVSAGQCWFGTDNTKSYGISWLSTSIQTYFYHRTTNTSVFPNNSTNTTPAGNQQISVQDVYISGSNLTIVFKNNHASTAYALNCAIDWEVW